MVQGKERGFEKPAISPAWALSLSGTRAGLQHFSEQKAVPVSEAVEALPPALSSRDCAGWTCSVGF